MKQWAYDCWIQIDQSIYLEQETVKAIVELRFNPGKGVAHLASASKGLTILTCRARTMAETERVRKQEHALSATENTHQLEDLLHFTKGPTHALALQLLGAQDEYRHIHVPRMAMRRSQVGSCSARESRGDGPLFGEISDKNVQAT